MESQIDVSLGIIGPTVSTWEDLTGACCFWLALIVELSGLKPLPLAAYQLGGG